jgi:hypothetical protein
MGSDIIDPNMVEPDGLMGAIWSAQCITPYQDAILLGDNILLIDENGFVTSGIHFTSIKQFGFEA